MNESIFVRLPGISNTQDPSYTEYGTKGTEALTPSDSVSAKFFDIALEGHPSSSRYEGQTVQYVAALIQVEAKDEPYFPVRDLNSSILPYRSNSRFRGIKEAEKFLLFSQSIAGSLLRDRDVLQSSDLALTTSEELLYPTDSDISSFYNATAQIRFYEWKRARKFDTRWFV